MVANFGLSPSPSCLKVSLQDSHHGMNMRLPSSLRAQDCHIWHIGRLHSLFGPWQARAPICRASPSSSSKRRFGARCSASSVNKGEFKDGTQEQSWDGVDVVTFGNLCVDVVLNVPELPPADRAEKLAYMERLAASPPDQSAWEGGGNSNFAIAAARLGLSCATLGHLGPEPFGEFLRQVLREEGVRMVDLGGGNWEGPLGDVDYDGSTLLCWVLVDPQHRHAFCSRFDFNKSPMFSRVLRLPRHASSAIRRSRALFCNGFAFDEFPPEAIVSAVEDARESGTAVFFDPGPRGRILASGTPQQRQTLNHVLHLSDVILLTDEEAEAVTGTSDAMGAARVLLRNGGLVQWVVIKCGAEGAVMATRDGIFSIPGFKVDVADTVGCGDSFAAAIVLGYTRSIPPMTTLLLANAVGAATALGTGAGRNVAKASKVAELLRGLQQPESGVEMNLKDWQSLELTFSAAEWLLAKDDGATGNGGTITTIRVAEQQHSTTSRLNPTMTRESPPAWKTTTPTIVQKRVRIQEAASEAADVLKRSLKMQVGNVTRGLR